MIVFGLLKRQDNVYTKIIPDASKMQLQRLLNQALLGMDVLSKLRISHDAGVMRFEP